MGGEQGPGGTVATDLEPGESWPWPDLMVAGVPVLEMEASVSAPRPSATCVSGEKPARGTRARGVCIHFGAPDKVSWATSLVPMSLIFPVTGRPSVLILSSENELNDPPAQRGQAPTVLLASAVSLIWEFYKSVVELGQEHRASL